MRKIHPLKRLRERSKQEQTARNRLAWKIRKLKIRAAKKDPDKVFVHLPFTCRSCWKLVPSEMIRFRVCKVCRMDKEDVANKVLKALLKAGIDESAAEATIAREMFC